MLTIVICTYRRNDLLCSCLSSLKAQSEKAFQTLVVDNYGDRECLIIAEKFGSQYVYEPQVGLSWARNRGWREATTEWVMYLDDDAKADKHLVATLLTAIRNTSFSAIGGRFTHWFRTPPPQWIHYEYNQDGYRPSLQSKLGELPQDCFLVGGVLAIKREVFKRIGGFNPGLGMSGRMIGWGEEDELQLRMRKGGLLIGYHPEMVIHHLVQPYKYKINNQIKMAYASGRDNRILEPPTYPYLKLLRTVLDVLLYRLPYDVVRIIARPGFYWQNAYINCVGRIARAWGMNRRQLVANA